MKRILVTGGTGTLGRLLVEQLAAQGHTVRVMSRCAQPSAADAALEWAVADLGSGAGLADAVAGVDAIIHAASSPGRGAEQVDVIGTERLVGLAAAAGVGHLVYISIVGIERIPVAYYRHKLAAEARVMQGGVPWSIQRATQFPELIDGMLRGAARLPVLALPTDFQFQVVEPGELARRLCTVVAAGPAGRLPDMGGPQLLTLGEMARAWRVTRGLRRPILHLPLPGGAARAFRRGYNTCPDHTDGAVTWAEWLARTYGAELSAHRLPSNG